MLTNALGVISAVLLMTDAVILIALTVVASATGDSDRYIPGESSEGPLGSAVFLTLVGLVTLELTIRSFWRWLRGQSPPDQSLLRPALGYLFFIPVFAVAGLFLLDWLGTAITAVRRQGAPLHTTQIDLILAIVVAWFPAIPIRTLVLNVLRKPTTRCVIEDGAVRLLLPYLDVGSASRGLRWRPVRVPFADLDSMRILPNDDPTMQTLLGETFEGQMWKAIFWPRIELVFDAIRPRTRWEGDLTKPTVLVWRMPFGVTLELRGRGLHYVVTADPDDARRVVEAFAEDRARPERASTPSPTG